MFFWEFVVLLRKVLFLAVALFWADALRARVPERRRAAYAPQFVLPRLPLASAVVHSRPWQRHVLGSLRTERHVDSLS